ncbi:protein angel homolog 2-like [Sycon ciliatum]|uniref:protein angel homolog 2-like n=1 Tax=Sycon ciliatum TaxID=27933 RepID=UPI0020ADA6F0|eukprot:scpid48637/ scgid4282/ Protein angel homolog 2
MAQRRRDDVFSTRHMDTVARKDGGGQTVNIVTYNVLSDKLLFNNPDLYPDRNGPYLNWEYRKGRLLKEILSYKADIVCLQEVEQKHFTEHFLPRLRDQGYAGVFMSRTGRKTDGCATFYRTSCFKLVGQKFVEYRKKDCHLLDRDNVAVLLLLESVSPMGSRRGSPPEMLCVANTHLLFNHNRGDVKLAQVMVLLAEVEQMATLIGPGGVHTRCPVLVAGDFNARPNSPLHQLVLRGKLNYSNLNAKEIDGEHAHVSGARDSLREIAAGRSHFLPERLGISNNCCFERAPCSVHHTLRHSMCLDSAYRHSPGENKFTTLHLRACTTVDYIFFSSQAPSPSWCETSSPVAYRRTLRLLSARQLPSQTDVRKEEALPNDVQSSDHVALQATLQFTDALH